MTSPAVGGSEKRRPGRSLFNRPQWSAPHPTEAKGDIFSRGAQSYAARVAEREAKRQKRAARKSSKAPSEDEKNEHREKRRRISDDDQSSDDESEGDDDGIEAKDNKTEQRSAKDSTAKQRAATDELSVSASPAPVTSPALNHVSQASQPKIEDLDIKKSPQATAETPNPSAESQPSKSNVIELTDDESDSRTDFLLVANSESRANTTSETAATTNEAAAVQDEGLASSEDEFPELAQKARQLARERKLGIHRSISPAPAPYEAADELKFSASRAEGNQSKPEAPVIKLLVTSRIPNTRRLEVRRKLDQRLRDVRRAWCQHSNLSEQDMMDVILVWRDMRMYDSSSCESLGLGVGADGDITLHGKRRSGEDMDRVGLEAMTIAMFEEMKREKQRRKALEDGAEQPEVEEQPKPKPKEAVEPKVRLVLRARGLSEVKVIMQMVRSSLRRRQWFLTFFAAYQNVPNCASIQSGKEASG